MDSEGQVSKHPSDRLHAEASGQIVVRESRLRALQLERLPGWGQVLLFWALYAALLGCFSPLSASFRGMWKGAFLGVVMSGATIVLTLWLLRRSDWSASDVGLAFRRDSIFRFFAGGVCGLALIALHYAIIKSSVEGVTLERVPEVGTRAILVAIVAFVPLAAMEELGFRGYPLHKLHASWNLWTAQLVVAVAFATYHVVGGFPWIQALLGTGTGSILFGMAAIASRGLALPIGLHAAWNIGGWSLGEKQEPGLWKIVVDPASVNSAGAAGAISYFAVLGLATFGFWLLYRSNESKDEMDSRARSKKA